MTYRVTGLCGCEQHPSKIIPEITAVVDILIDGKTVLDCPLMQNVKTGEAGQRKGCHCGIPYDRDAAPNEE
jgi:hypothetical protein